MIKRLITTLIVSLVLALPTLSVSAGQAENEPSTEMKIEVQREHNQALAHKMMGHINLAQFALELSLPSEASNHIKKAQGLEETLDAQMPEMKLKSSYKYGKVTFDDNETIKSHYIPIVDDVFLISDYEAVFDKSSDVDLNETTAGIVHVGVSVDLREVDKGLDVALAHLDKNEYSKAQEALQTIFDGVIVDEEEVDDPVLSIYENLALAKTFVLNNQYDSARLTLGHIEDRLKNAKEDQLAGVDKETKKSFAKELKEIKKQLHEKDPTLSQKIGDRLAKWGDNVKGWFK